MQISALSLTHNSDKNCTYQHRVAQTPISVENFFNAIRIAPHRLAAPHQRSGVDSSYHNGMFAFHGKLCLLNMELTNRHVQRARSLALSVVVTAARSLPTNTREGSRRGIPHILPRTQAERCGDKRGRNDLLRHTSTDRYFLRIPRNQKVVNLVSGGSGAVLEY